METVVIDVCDRDQFLTVHETFGITYSRGWLTLANAAKYARGHDSGTVVRLHSRQDNGYWRLVGKFHGRRYIPQV